MGRKKYVQLKSLIDNTPDSKILTDIDPMLPIVNTFEYILQFKKKIVNSTIFSNLSRNTAFFHPLTIKTNSAANPFHPRDLRSDKTKSDRERESEFN